MFQFENFRVRKLAAINALNFYITMCMAFLAHMSMKSETHALKAAIIQKADPIKEKVQFSYYRLAKGISGILSYAKEGIRLWFRTKRPSYRQLCLILTLPKENSSSMENGFLPHSFVIRERVRSKRPAYRQLCLKLTA